nr:MAG: hypothetical protein [Sanya fiers-like virus 44]
MPQQADIAILDGATTPVSHTFVANGASRMPDNRQLCDWIDFSSSVAAARWSIREVQRPANGSGKQIVEWVIPFPTMKVMGASVVGFEPAPEVDFVDNIRVSVEVNERTSDAQRKHIRAVLKNFTALAYVQDKILTFARTT